MNHSSELLRRTITGLIILISSALLLLVPSYILSFVLVAIASSIIYFELPRIAPILSGQFMVLAIGYIIIPFTCLIILNENQFYNPLIALIIITVFSHDTSAYLIGRLLGKHKIAPTISPGKTWEGFIGGYCLTALALTCINLYYAKMLSTTIFLDAGIITIAATLGDFFESWLKRRASIKDTGKILPGHGGLLDRFDSIIVVSLVVFFLRNYFIHIIR